MAWRAVVKVMFASLALACSSPSATPEEGEVPNVAGGGALGGHAGNVSQGGSEAFAVGGAGMFGGAGLGGISAVAGGGAGGVSAVAGGGAGSARTPKTISITFDDVRDGTWVSSGPGVTFSTVAGQGTRAFAYGEYCRTSAPNALCFGQAHACGRPKILTFTTPVDKLRFRCGCTDVAKQIGVARVTHGNEVTDVPIIGKGDPTRPVDVDLSRFIGVTSVRIDENGIDGQGFTVDDIQFVRYE